jgi:hypothetical protein
MPLGKLHFLFVSCLLPQVLVVASGGRLLGVVLRDDLSYRAGTLVGAPPPALPQQRGGNGGGATGSLPTHAQ